MTRNKKFKLSIINCNLQDLRLLMTKLGMVVHQVGLNSPTKFQFCHTFYTKFIGQKQHMPIFGSS